ncbi:MAG: hypothetical protein CSB44_11785 [Gammaproteobacteria bacterium]|nr:MAG: hypothetical protein CSB44_11785 [Gammaproteobacteria bacterium]
MQSISKAASKLNISEFRLFSEAYLAWFGDRADDEDITLLFAQFMMFGELPDWADQYARSILDDLAANRQVNLNSFCILNMSPRVDARAPISFSIMS